MAPLTAPEQSNRRTTAQAQPDDSVEVANPSTWNAFTGAGAFQHKQLSDMLSMPPSFPICLWLRNS